MLDLLQITNDPAFARRCDALPGMRLFVDLERLGKAERQAGRNTFISAHQLDDVARIRDVLTQTPLMVRVNPLHEGTGAEVDAVLAAGADLLMLPMFASAAELGEFSAIVAGRKPIVPLLETAKALASLDEWIATPGLAEVFVGLNDLHLSLGCSFMFEPLARGLVDRVATAAKARHLRFGFGGIARLDEGLLPGRDVLAEHLRLGSGAVILSRTFHHGDSAGSFEDQVQALREAERQLVTRDAQQVEADRLRIHGVIQAIAMRMGQAA
ncbi:MAG: aldolase [Burkholderiaceae bacterium]|nr:aldolase [Burkholderiaceae bacterium]